MMKFGEDNLCSDLIIAFSTYPISDYYSAYLVSNVLYFRLEDRTMVLNLTVACHCLSLVLHDLNLALFNLAN